MWNPQTMELMPGFWAPKPSRFWNVALEPVRKHYLHRFYGISSVEIVGAERIPQLKRMIDSPDDGVLIAPNHSHDSDPHVMIDVGHQLGRQLYFMAAWQVVLAHKGIDGWVMQRFGAFSVDREGCDRRAMRQATELLTTGKSLVVFPEGEIYHTNERLTPLREGVAFMAITAQRDLDKSAARVEDEAPAEPRLSHDSARQGPRPPSHPVHRQIWVVPTCIKYAYEEDITPKLEAAVTNLE